MRILAPLGRYPLPKYLAAVTLGRFPRLLLFAGFGVAVSMPAWLPLSVGVLLLAIGAGSVARRSAS